MLLVEWYKGNSNWNLKLVSNIYYDENWNEKKKKNEKENFHFPFIRIYILKFLVCILLCLKKNEIKRGK